MGVYLPIKDYSAMQGPSPSGFHVPLTTEWQAVKDIRTALGGGGSDGTNFGIALKLPFAGSRHYSSAGVNNQGSYGLYWSSSRNDTNNAYSLYFGSTALFPQLSGYRAQGFSVRCFKDYPVVPTSSWTKLYGTSIEAGGIFWSSADGLISLSSDGQIWITIADKNLGATTVWNSGDTLSEVNCGKYYQWGNNYGFPRTGSVTTSSTQVDASSYGPGNYYSSSTFITRSSSPYRWDTTDNANLWGGVTGIKPMSELKNAYIGEVRVPGANTIAYYKFDGNLNDSSGNGFNLSMGSGPMTYGTTSGGATYGTFTGSNWTNTLTTTGSHGTTYTLSCWLNTLSNYGGNYQNIMVELYYSSQPNVRLMNGKSKISCYDNNTTGPSISTNNWYHVAITRNGSTLQLYLNGVYQNSWTASATAGFPLRITLGSKDSPGSTWAGQGQLSNVIIENKARTSQEISNYYNLTKSNYQSSSGGTTGGAIIR